MRAPPPADVWLGEQQQRGLHARAHVARVLLVFGRYVPGLRFVVNTTMGLSDRPYREFIPWSALGGVMWSAYTCLLAYWVGSKLEDYPLGSVYISGAITTLLIAGFYSAERRRRKRRPAAAAPTEASIS